MPVDRTRDGSAGNGGRTLSPHNSSLLAEIGGQNRAFRAGSLPLAHYQAFIAARTGLFENDGSGIRGAAAALDAEFEHILYAVEESGQHAEAIVAAEGFLSRFS
ncbi:hypothetical protein GCM10009651_33600 [Microbacterium natoriense]